jgi:hypothetical protein
MLPPSPPGSISTPHRPGRTSGGRGGTPLFPQSKSTIQGGHEIKQCAPALTDMRGGCFGLRGPRLRSGLGRGSPIAASNFSEPRSRSRPPQSPPLPFLTFQGPSGRPLFGLSHVRALFSLSHLPFLSFQGPSGRPLFGLSHERALFCLSHLYPRLIPLLDLFPFYPCPTDRARPEQSIRITGAPLRASRGVRLRRGSAPAARSTPHAHRPARGIAAPLAASLEVSKVSHSWSDTPHAAAPRPST